MYFARDEAKPENVTFEVSCDEAEEQLLITDLLRRQAGEPVVEEPKPKKKRQSHQWSQAQRDAAAERMRKTQAKMKEEREGVSAEDESPKKKSYKPNTMLRPDDEERMRKFREKER